MAHDGSMDSGRNTTQGFSLGLALFGIGVVGDVLDRGLFGGLPPWEATLFLVFEGGGTLPCLVVSLIFGIVLPPTE